jgi:hypothetical protein
MGWWYVSGLTFQDYFLFNVDVIFHGPSIKPLHARWYGEHWEFQNNEKSMSRSQLVGKKNRGFFENNKNARIVPISGP